MANEHHFPSADQMDVTIGHLVRIGEAIEGTGLYTGFEGMQRAVRAGLGPTQFPIGSEFIVPHTTYGDLVCVVVAHDYLKSAHDSTAHTMTCMVKTVLPSVQFDGPEAFFYADEAIPAGTYHFSLGAKSGSWEAGSYQFTLANALPKGGQLAINGNTSAALTACQVGAYASRTTLTATESVAITAGSGGTNLGELGAGLNHSQRVRNGSNNYKESAIRQFLNSAASAGSVWKPQTKFDRPPSWVSTLDGFEAGLSADFLAAVGEVNLPNSANGTYESPDSEVVVGASYVTKDKFYVLSRKEVYGTTALSEDETALLPYYDGASDTDRIGFNAEGGVAYQWLRTPYRTTAYTIYVVTPDGSFNPRAVDISFGVTPAFSIL